MSRRLFLCMFVVEIVGLVALVVVVNAKAQTITCTASQHTCIRNLLLLTSSGRCGWVTQGPTIWRVACPD